MYRQRLLENPFRPGAGHLPPILAGRHGEQTRFKRILFQPLITENLLITGLRGYGKTVLLSHFRHMAEANDWLWVGNDLSESSSLSEERLALRIITDLAEALAVKLDSANPRPNHLQQKLAEAATATLGTFTFDSLKSQYEQAPGLPSDKLRSVLLRVTELVRKSKLAGLVLAYDEAQCLSDRAENEQFPMSMLVETVSALQKRDGLSPCLLVLCGLPQVFDALTSTRTYTERMFTVFRLDRLTREETLAALEKPLANLQPLNISPGLVDKLATLSGGYPYLIQFFGREAVDELLANGGVLPPDHFPSHQTMDRLDVGLFAARWNRTTDKQREILGIIANRPSGGSHEFSAKEIVDWGDSEGDATSTQVQSVLAALTEKGMLYRTRHGRYAFTIPLSEIMILRRLKRDETVEMSWACERPELSSVQAARPAPPQPEKKRGWFRR